MDRQQNETLKKEVQDGQAFLISIKTESRQEAALVTATYHNLQSTFYHK